jgi:hypothetical protein
MTAKEKAEELVENFFNLYPNQDAYFIAQRCALIAVDEILQNFGQLTEGKQHYAAYYTIKYYEEVKQEIEKL